HPRDRRGHETGERLVSPLPVKADERRLSIVGQSVRRADTLEKVTGAAKFVGDMAFHRLLHGKIKRAPIAHARIAHIDVSRAFALPGVRAVLTHANVPRVLHY